jgi:hypothetical protein
MSLRASRLERGLTVCLALLLAGCGSKGTISGMVTYQGKPIPSGNVTFFPANGAPVVATISDGKYTAEKVAAGPARVAVVSISGDPGGSSAAGRMMDAKPPPDAPMPEEARKVFEGKGRIKKGIRIPANYSDPDKSGLTCTVTGGSQTHDIDLK